MVSPLDLAKRAFVTLLRALALAYGLSLQVSRDSDDAALRQAFRNVSRKTHPDKGGCVEDQESPDGRQEHRQVFEEDVCRNRPEERCGLKGMSGCLRRAPWSQCCLCSQVLHVT